VTYTKGPFVLEGASLRAAALATLVVSFGLVSAGGRIFEGLRKASEWATGQSLPRVCSFRAQTGFPCMGCFGTRAFEEATRGHVGHAVHLNPLGAFVGLAAWLLGLASAVTLLTAWRLPFLWAWGLAVGLSPLVLLWRAVTWWSALPAAAFQLH
jgi:hypothetical protein